MGDERPAGSVTPLVELPCGVRPARNRRGARGIVVARAESSWRARNRRGARGIVVAHAESSWSARGMERAPLARSALADSAVGVLIVVDESPARDGGDEGVRWIWGVVGSRVRAVSLS